MKIRRLIVDGYKNVRSCDVDFDNSQLIHTVIGNNGSGKSNVIEAILHILIGTYFERPPEFRFRLEYEAQNRAVVLQRNDRFSVTVDGQSVALDRFALRLRDGPAQVCYPELTLLYYSGECRRVRRLVSRYRRHFQQLTRHPDTDRTRPLFVLSSNEQSDVILLALFAHGRGRLLAYLGIVDFADIEITLRSPEGFDPERHEPKLWNSEGAIRRVLAAIDETSFAQTTTRYTTYRSESSSDAPGVKRRDRFRDERTFKFSLDGIRKLAQRLENESDNIYLAIESLKARGLFRCASFRLYGRNHGRGFKYDHLSEGEKQLIAVVGAVALTNLRDNLILLDEPDTHLNPQWSWDYPSLIAEALAPGSRNRSLVLMATHDPVMISGMARDQVLLSRTSPTGGSHFSRPMRAPRGQGVANILCSSEFFGLPSSLDKETQKLLDERIVLSIKRELTTEDKARLKRLNELLNILPGVTERDPEYVAFLRQRHPTTQP